METVSKNLYEGMFLVDSALAASDWDGVMELIKNILNRAEAEIVSLSKWDERKLAYEINKKSRGTYLLCYFKVAGERVKDIERDVKLSEKIMRVLILSTEPMSQEDIDRETPVVAAERKAAEAVAAAEAKVEEAKAAAEAKAKEVEAAAEAKAEEVEVVAEPAEAEVEEAKAAAEAKAEEVEAAAEPAEAEIEEAKAVDVAEESADDVVSEVEEVKKDED
ncbi:MAG: 30S ribosomal protein S6 [Planctomycetes bacterium]|nr:30S ribosomal protein S6 [Planctomycetota bacterium]